VSALSADDLRVLGALREVTFGTLCSGRTCARVQYGDSAVRSLRSHTPGECVWPARAAGSEMYVQAMDLISEALARKGIALTFKHKWSCEAHSCRRELALAHIARRGSAKCEFMRAGASAVRTRAR
jgi:hypothetical protein